jgi:probable HAF family extracellular repeat protein
MVTQLGTLPGFDSSIATGINDSEQVVGVSYSQQNPEHQAGFIWTAQTGMQVIEGAASASGINSLVDIAATSLALRAAIFTATGATIDLGTLGDFSVATSVHSKRNAVGYSPTQSGGPVHAFFYNGTMQDLGTMQVGSNTNATSVNDSDLVVGGSNLAGNSLAFVWSATTGIQDLNGLDLSEFRLGTGNGGGGRPRKESS